MKCVFGEADAGKLTLMPVRSRVWKNWIFIEEDKFAGIIEVSNGEEMNASG